MAVAETMRIEVGTTAPQDWDAYVSRRADASAYHRAAAVGIGSRAFALETMYLAARDSQSRIVGVLPLVEQSSALFGRFLVSVPFFTYGGIIADDEEAAALLAERAAGIARERRARHLELRHTAPMNVLGMPQRLDKVSMILELPASEDDLGKRLGRKMRWEIRQAEKHDLDVEWGGAQLLPEFYRVFAPVMHQLGTPVYPPRFFETVLDAIGESATVLVLRMGGRVEAGAIIVRHRDRIEVPWAVTTPAGKRAMFGKRMYWELLREAIAVGARAFDFGRSSVGSGTYHFKSLWGAKPMQLHWHYWLRAGGELPRLNQSNPKYAVAAAIWRRMPLWCANRLGPRLARSLP